MKHKIFTTIITIVLIFGTIPAAFASAEKEASQVEAPIEVTAKAKKTGKIVVKWAKSESATSYSVYRATKKSGKYKLIKTTKKCKYTDKKIRPKKTYYYQIAVNRNNGDKTVSSNTSEIVSAKLKIKKSFKVKAYAYSGGGTTASGKKAKVGRIAVDPKVIKLGTWLYVEGYGYCQACDTGGNIKGKTIDVYKKSNKQARKWGVKKPRIYILG